MVSFDHFSLWVSLSSLFFALFSFFFRVLDDGKNLETFDDGKNLETFDDGGCDVMQPPEVEANGGEGGGADEVIIDEKESNEFVFSFRFQTYDEFRKSKKEAFDCERLSNRYEFLPENSTIHFVEEAQIPSFTVEVLNSSSKYEVLGNEDLSVRDFSRKVLEFEAVDEKINKETEKQRDEEDNYFVRETDIGFDYDTNIGDIRNGFISDFDEPDKETKTEKIEQSSSKYREEEPGKLKQRDEEDNDIVRETDIDSDYDMNISDIRNGLISDFDIEKTKTEEIEQSSSKYREEEQRKLKQNDEEEDNDIVRETDSGSDPDTNANNIGDGFLSDSEFDFTVEGYEPDEEMNEGSEKSPEDPEETNGLETEWEHQELVEQLKMELKRVRATGLPTIFEESEAPKIMGELKPWKIDERFKHGDLMEELHKFYRSYRERMRKLDILNYQKMYAMGVLQSKDPLKTSPSNGKSSSMTSLLRLYRQKKCQVDPMKDFIREVHCDLEMVYVGQMCLSWEFIQWQYQKALALWDSHPLGGVHHHYNEVAGDFQQFQVLLQRFLENEAFEGPRVENYVKHRCVARNLLQVPVIREDKTKDRRKGRWRDHENEASTNETLVEILQESIRVIWKFIRTDKDHQRPKKFQVELQDPVDKQLLIEIQADLQKKERKLKEIVRSGHCILKKLKRNNEEEDEEREGSLSFFCEVDMKLVGRVLRMSTITTDQLVWCSNKLSRINFFNRKIHVEPSFFLFPC